MQGILREEALSELGQFIEKNPEDFIEGVFLSPEEISSRSEIADIWEGSLPWKSTAQRIGFEVGVYLASRNAKVVLVERNEHE